MVLLLWTSCCFSKYCESNFLSSIAFIIIIYVFITLPTSSMFTTPKKHFKKSLNWKREGEWVSEPDPADNCISLTSPVTPCRPSRAPPWACTGVPERATSLRTGVAVTWVPSTMTACPTAAPSGSPCKCEVWRQGMCLWPQQWRALPLLQTPLMLFFSLFNNCQSSPLHSFRTEHAHRCTNNTYLTFFFFLLTPPNHLL